MVPDVIPLVCGHHRESAWHGEARECREGLLNAGRRAGIRWIVATGFVRLAAIGKVFSPPVPSGDAAERVEAWLEPRNVSPVNPGPGRLIHFRHLLEAAAGA